MTKALARVVRRPNPEDWADDDPLTLTEAVAVFSDKFPMTVSTLRTEIRRGRLTPAEVAGKHLVTPAQIKALFRCPVTPKAPASTFGQDGPKKVSSPSGSSETERLRAAQAAALSISRRPSASSASISPPSSRRRPARPTADVIQIRS